MAAACTVDVRPRVRKALRQLDPRARNDALVAMRASPAIRGRRVPNPSRAIRLG